MTHLNSHSPKGLRSSEDKQQIFPEYNKPNEQKEDANNLIHLSKIKYNLYGFQNQFKILGNGGYSNRCK